jgi:hypothetical protein
MLCVTQSVQSDGARQRMWLHWASAQSDGVPRRCRWGAQSDGVRPRRGVDAESGRVVFDDRRAERLAVGAL